MIGSGTASKSRSCQLQSTLRPHRNNLRPPRRKPVGVNSPPHVRSRRRAQSRFAQSSNRRAACERPIVAPTIPPARRRRKPEWSIECPRFAHDAAIASRRDHAGRARGSSVGARWPHAPADQAPRIGRCAKLPAGGAASRPRQIDRSGPVRTARALRQVVPAVVTPAWRHEILPAASPRGDGARSRGTQARTRSR